MIWNQPPELMDRSSSQVLPFGSSEDPLDGNVVVTIFATKTTTNSTCPDCVDSFLDALKSDNLTAILAESGLRRPF